MRRCIEFSLSHFPAAKSAFAVSTVRLATDKKRVPVSESKSVAGTRHGLITEESQLTNYNLR